MVFIRKVLKFFFNKPVVFEDGSYVDWLNREAIVYVESDRKVFINFLFDINGETDSARMINKGELENWNSQDSEIQMSFEEKLEVLNKVARYCENKNIPLTVFE